MPLAKFSRTFQSRDSRDTRSESESSGRGSNSVRRLTIYQTKKLLHAATRDTNAGLTIYDHGIVIGVVVVTTGHYIPAIRGAFDQVDLDKSGQLGLDGTRKVLQLIGQNPTHLQMQEYFDDEIDTIDRECIGDFVEENVPLKSQATINDEVAEAFAKFDPNQNFLITISEFRDILTKIGDEPLTEEEADAIIESLGERSDDTLDITDLSKLLSA